jgi:murein L,D-transpeptidase YafK
MKIVKYIVNFFLILFAALVTYNYFPEEKLPNNTKIDSLIVYKSKRELQAWEKGVIVKKYKISLGKNPFGPKQFEGDNKTPEGNYVIFDKNPYSDYHNNLGVSYPNDFDLENSKKHRKSAGADIKLHGLPTGLGFLGKIYRNFDWTAGCIAITNGEIDEISNSTKIGTPIKIFP